MEQKNYRSFIFFSVIILISLIVLLQYLVQPTKQDIPDLVIIGTSADYPPFSFYQNDQIVGFDIDVAQEAVKRLGKQSAIKNVPFELLIPQATVGEIQVIAAGLSITPERTKKLLFTKPYYLDEELVVLSMSDEEPIRSLHDLNNKKVAVNIGYSADAYISKLSNIAIERVPSIDDALDALSKKYVDAFVTAASTVQVIFKKLGQEHFNIFVIEETSETVALAISKMYPKLALEMTNILNAMDNDGTLEQLKQRWNL